jgi:hypothetical protein
MHIWTGIAAYDMGIAQNKGMATMFKIRARVASELLGMYIIISTILFTNILWYPPWHPSQPLSQNRPLLDFSIKMLLVGCAYVAIVLIRAKMQPEIKLLFRPERVARPGLGRFAAALACICVSISAYYLFYGDFKLRILYESCQGIYGGQGAVALLSLAAYCIGEMFIIVLLVCSVQRIAGERGRLVPYGGLFLALTWGAAHFFIKGPVTGNIWMALDFKFWDIGSAASITAGTYYVVVGLLIGIVFNLLNKDFRYAFPAAALLYLL